MLAALLESVLKTSTRYVLQWIGPYFDMAKSNSHLKASTLASFPGPAFHCLQYDFLFARRKLGMRLHQHCNLWICSQKTFLLFFLYNYVDL